MKKSKNYLNKKQKKSLFHIKKINGYHFINWSCENGSLYKPITNNEWFEKEIKKALNDSNTKPIFVTTHFPPYDTVYGSKEWNDWLLNGYFKEYPQIINFSGDSHFSLIDERSIYQKDYTAIQTQSLSYIELEEGKVNGSIPMDEFDDYMISTNNSMGLICDVNDNAIVIKRISFEKNEFYGDDWIIDVPINKNNFKYLYETMDKNSIKPEFIFENEDDKKVLVEKIGDRNIIKFKQAVHPYFIHSYKIIFKTEDNEEYQYLYFSDFFLMPSDRKKIISFRINEHLKGKFNIKIYAIESFGKESDNFMEDNIFIELIVKTYNYFLF